MAPARRDYAATLALGAAGALIVLLSVRQGWARVVTSPPEPLPATSVRVSGQSLVPLAGALGVAALAGLAAVIATRRLARRLTGLLLAAFGVILAVAVSMPLAAAEVAAAAHAATGSVTGSATAGGTGGNPAGAVPVGAGAGLSIAGHVTMTGFPWRPLTVAGALMIVVAGLAVAWRGGSWRAMSARYEPPTGRPSRGRAAPQASQASGAGETADPPDTSGGRDTSAAGDSAGARDAPDSAVMWEALSAGIDPTDPG